MEFELRVVPDKGRLVSTFHATPMAALAALAHDTEKDGSFTWHRASCVWHKLDRRIQQWELNVD